MEEPMTPAEILDLPMQPNDAQAATVRDYLVALLKRLWMDGEGFSGKRPFGNSGWSYDLFVPLAKAGLVPGELDEDGYLDAFDVDAAVAEQLILSAIDALGARVQETDNE